MVPSRCSKEKSMNIMPFRASQMRTRPDQFCGQLTTFSDYVCNGRMFDEIALMLYPVGITVIGVNPATIRPQLSWQWEQSTVYTGGWTRIK